MSGTLDPKSFPLEWPKETLEGNTDLFLKETVRIGARATFKKARAESFVYVGKHEMSGCRGRPVLMALLKIIRTSITHAVNALNSICEYFRLALNKQTVITKSSEEERATICLLCLAAMHRISIVQSNGTVLFGETRSEGPRFNEAAHREIRKRLRMYKDACEVEFGIAQLIGRWKFEISEMADGGISIVSSKLQESNNGKAVT